MTEFLVLTGVLLAMVLAALLWPQAARLDGSGAAGQRLALLERGELDIASYCAQTREADALRRDQLARTRRGRRLGGALSMLILLASAGLYVLLGPPAALNAPAAGELAQGAAHGQDQADLQALTARLAERLKAQPDDVAGWAMLGRSYAALGQFGAAVAVYEKAVATAAPDAGLLADYADALAAANNGKFNDKARALVKQALAADPRDPKALSLAGTIAYDDGDFAGAAAHWTILRDALPEGPQRAGIERSLAEAGQAGAPPTPTPPLLGGEVTLAPTLRARLEPSDQLFIVARSTDSTGGPPLAVRRMPAVFPAAFTLSDAESMLSDSKLSNVRAVSLTAHIAKAGSRTAAAPDLAVRLEHVAVGSLGLRLAIGQAVQ